MEVKLRTNVVPIAINIGVENDFVGVIDLITMKAIYWSDDKAADNFEVSAIPKDMLQLAADHRVQMLDKISEYHDGILEKVLADSTIEEEDIYDALRSLTISNTLYPVLCGSALKNKGIQHLIDAIVRYLPSPTDVEPCKTFDKHNNVAARKPSNNESFIALVFKITTDPFMGRVAFIRVYAGTLDISDTVTCTRLGLKTRLGRIVEVHANTHKAITKLQTGDIAACTGLKNIQTGDTICLPGDDSYLEKIEFREPVIAVALLPKTKHDHEKMMSFLDKYKYEDPSLRVETSEEAQQTIISGMGELHLEVVVDRMRSELDIKVEIGQPRVAYKETISKEYEAVGKYIKQSGGRGQYGHVAITFKPLPRGTGFVFIDKIVGGIIPKEYIPAIQKGVINQLNIGVFLGYPVTDIQATLHYGSFHEVDSSEIAFKLAAEIATRDAIKNADPVLLEPIAHTVVSTFEDYAGSVISDLSKRRGSIGAMDKQDGQAVQVSASVPLAQMFGYATALRSLTQGRATFTMEIKQYSPTPKSIVSKMLEDKANCKTK